VPISDRDLRYLHGQKRDQSKWSWQVVDYYEVDETTTTVNPMTKEPDPGQRDSGLHVLDTTPKQLPARMRVTAPRVIGDQRAGGATTPEHTIIFQFAARDLEFHSINPKPGDEIETQGIRYRVKQPRLDKFVAKAPFNLEFEVEVTRVETATQPDLPSPVSRHQ
jgi:hypothetical protein